MSQWLAEHGCPEQAAISAGLLLPASIARQPWLHLGATAFFVLLHGRLLYRLLAFVGGQHTSKPAVVQLLFPLAMLTPTFYGAAHIRHLIPIIPLLLLMLFERRPYNPSTLA